MCSFTSCDLSAAETGCPGVHREQQTYSGFHRHLCQIEMALDPLGTEVVMREPEFNGRSRQPTAYPSLHTRDRMLGRGMFWRQSVESPSLRKLFLFPGSLLFPIDSYRRKSTAHTHWHPKVVAQKHISSSLVAKLVQSGSTFIRSTPLQSLIALRSCLLLLCVILPL